ncbi:MAG: hypothetical protein JNM07_11955 [Phycisphaerae bacterium]|nr:hypothetical protein [Phycisphaerae bacterium]
MNPDPTPAGQPHLTDGLFAPVAPRPTVRARMNAAARGSLAGLRALAARPRVRAGAAVALVLAMVGGGTFAYLELRPRPMPNVATDDLDSVLDYALMTEDFNRLPVDKRLDLIKDLIARLKSVTAEDSSALAMFATSIMGAAREQLMKNAGRLGADVMDQYAKEYVQVPADDRGAFLDDKLIEFTKMMEQLTGQNMKESETERLAMAKKQAKRDYDRARSSADQQLTRDRAARFFQFIHRQGDQMAADAEQKGRLTRFMRDMTRHLRGQDPSTGKPVGPG